MIAARYNTVEATYGRGMERLVMAVQELSMARTMDDVMKIVRRVARELTGADGATFVLKDGDHCYYADEDAIAPLWKGSRFPMNACVSGWSMKHRKAVVIQDVYKDDRIPLAAYKPTFVKSMVMVPIRTIDPIGAIGSYWAAPHQPTEEEVNLLKALADITAVSLENIDVYSALEEKLKERNRMLSRLSDQNKQLEDFCHIISHNLRAPVANLLLLVDMVRECEQVEEKMEIMEKLKPVIDFLHETFEQLVDATQVKMDFAIEKDYVDLEECLQKVSETLLGDIIASHAVISHDFSKVRSIYYPKKYAISIIFNLLSNAIKYRSDKRQLKVHFRTLVRNGRILLEVSDNGMGIDVEKYADKLFKLGKTFHHHLNSKGFGLFITKTQVEAMGGKIAVRSAPDAGAIFEIQLYKVNE